MDLFPSIKNRRILLSRVLQFDDAEGNPIYEEQNVGTSFRSVLANGELIDRAKDVCLRILKVDVLYVPIRPRRVITGEGEAVDAEIRCRTKGEVVRVAARIA